MGTHYKLCRLNRAHLNTAGQWLKRHLELALHVLLAAACCVLTTLPLVGLPGYEFSAVLAVMYGTVGTLVAAFAPARSARSQVVRHTFTFVVSMLPGLLLAIVRASPCSPFSAIAFFPLLAMVSAFVAACAGTFIASVAKRWWAKVMLALALFLVSAMVTVWPIVFGPQVFAFDHFGGFLPGPIYDETLSVTTALFWFRAGSVALGVVFAGLAARRPTVWLPALLTFAVIEVNGPAIGFRMTDGVLSERLGALTETNHFIVHTPRGKSKAELERFVADLEFRHAQISAFLGQTPAGKVTVWLYRSADEKQRLVGAQHTQFAKPWRREVHINERGFPHPVVKHELMHAMAAPFGAPPFGVTATLGGLSPVIGIIEGLAVAGDNPVDELTLHEGAAAMKKQHLLPDVRILLAPQGFYSAPASRAYSAAGSFMRWLGDTHGGEKLRALYRNGDFEGVYARPLTDLASDWERFLETVPLDEGAVNQAFARFKQGSIFDRHCAREVALLTAKGSSLLRENPMQALDVYERCQALQPEEPSHQLAGAEALRRLGRLDDAAKVLEALIERVKTVPSAWADAALALAEVSAQRGDVVTAQTLLSKIIATHASPAIDRTANVRLASMALPPGALEAVRQALNPTADDGLRSYWLLKALSDAPRDATLSYLLGRRLAALDASSDALRYLDDALEAPQPPSLRRETMRLAIEAAFRAGRCERVRTLATQAKTMGSAFGARADDWVQRCDFK